jgi:hypothetical protein
MMCSPLSRRQAASVKITGASHGASPGFYIIHFAAERTAGGIGLSRCHSNQGPDSLKPPYKNGGEADGGEIISRESVVASWDAPEVLQSVCLLKVNGCFLLRRFGMTGLVPWSSNCSRNNITASWEVSSVESAVTIRWQRGQRRRIINVRANASLAQHRKPPAYGRHIMPGDRACETLCPKPRRSPIFRTRH